VTRLRTLELDAAIIDRLLPHRDPMRLVDRVTGFTANPQPRLRAELHVRGDEPVLAGHFPDQPIWPGVLIIEGLAQAGGLLVGITTVVRECGDAALEQLATIAALPERPPSGWLVRVAVDLVAPVHPPATILYEVRHAGEHAGLIRIDARASVAERSVAQGMITLAIGAQP
jgi:3-hydroxyacyl-[acyl-carrier-protein] dehydratase